MRSRAREQAPERNAPAGAEAEARDGVVSETIVILVEERAEISVAETGGPHRIDHVRQPVIGIIFHDDRWTGSVHNIREIASRIVTILRVPFCQAPAVSQAVI